MTDSTVNNVNEKLNNMSTEYVKTSTIHVSRNQDLNSDKHVHFDLSNNAYVEPEIYVRTKTYADAVKSKTNNKYQLSINAH